MSTSPDNLYHYHPHPAAAGTACALFLLTLLLHTYQTLRTRTNSLFTIPLLLGILCEVIGYAARLINALETRSESTSYSLAPYIIQSILLLIAPPLIAATLYIHLGHVISVCDGIKLSVHPRLLTWIFVTGDILSFCVQGTGAALLTKPEQERKDVGSWIVIGGLVVQLLFFGAFLIVAGAVWRRIHGLVKRNCKVSTVRLPWGVQLCILLSTATLVLVRSLFRVVEYAQGTDGYLLKHEVFLYVFDGLPMFGAVAAWNVVHFSRISAFTKSDGGYMINKVFAVCKSAEVKELPENVHTNGAKPGDVSRSAA